MGKLYDLIIVGAGPAGSTLARLAGALLPLRVLLLESRRLDEPGPERLWGRGIKSCGGLLAPDAQRALARLHGALPVRLLADPQLFTVRAIDLASHRESSYQRFYVNIRREAFDRWLFSKITGVTTLCGVTITGLHRAREGWVLSTADGRAFAGRFVAGADGARSVTRRKLFPALPVRRYISRQEAFPADAAAPCFAAIFDPSLTDYYAWGLPKDGEYLLGAALPEGRDANQRFRQLKSALREYGFRLDAPLRHEATLLTRPLPALALSPPVSADGSACLLGEAGGFVSPSSAEGISYALNSASALYEALAGRLRHAAPDDPAFFPDACRAYARALLPLRGKLAGKNLKSQFLYRPLLRRLIMASGLQALPLPPDQRCPRPVLFFVRRVIHKMRPMYGPPHAVYSYPFNIIAVCRTVRGTDAALDIRHESCKT